MTFVKNHHTMKFNKVIVWSVTVALGGFLFGLDTAVISGCERTIQQLWGLSDALTGQMVAMALYGTIAGAIFGGIPEIYSLMFFRLLGGLSIGASSVVAPMYITEIAPAEKRGQLTALFQFNIVFGILLAYLSNWIIGTEGISNWRWMLGVVAVPSLLFVVAVLFIPESPRWLVLKQGRSDAALAILEQINLQTAKTSLESIMQGNSDQDSKRVSYKELFSAN